jgi:D-alanyl-D-alanine carboxypeptidase
MKKEAVQAKIENLFRTQVQNDKKVRNAYLLVHSDDLGLHMNLAEGQTNGREANPAQPNHMASVGKLFTATIIGMLHDQKKLSFDDPISKYLDEELIKGLHVFEGNDYSGKIKISHLLNQSTGLDDVFYVLWDKSVKESQVINPREAVIWGKENRKPKFPSGKKHLYTDTNYYLLGLIVENITKAPFHEALHELIFRPLGMNHAYMHGYSEPSKKSDHPNASLHIHGVDALNVPGFSRIDYAGGGVVAPMEELLMFMKALVQNKLLQPETLERMLTDDYRKLPGIRYGYSTWKFVTIPILQPEKYNCWGCVGISGAYMFFHPKTDSYVIGTFNDTSYSTKALRFMLSKVIRNLLKCRKD